jgi:hypothetical protein
MILHYENEIEYINIHILFRRGAMLIYIPTSVFTVKIYYRYKTLEANGNTNVIPTTCKSFSLYREFL